MPFDINKFVNQNNPLSKIADKLSTSFSDRAENALMDSVGDIFAKVGLGASSGKDILSNLGDAVLAGIASEFFGSFNKDVNRISKEDIEKNKGFADGDTEGLDAISKSTPDANLPLHHFPKDLNKYYTLFSFKKYERPTPRDEAKFESVFDIALPIPRNIVDNHRILYSEQTLGPLGNVVDYMAQQEKTYTGAAVTATAAMKRRLAARIAANVVPEVGAITSQLSGSIVNPALSAVFESPTFRRHSFEWMFAPETPEESDDVRNIISKLKSASLPNFIVETTALLQYPMICKIEFMPWARNKEKNNLFEFKTAVIENVYVNYSPNTPAFFARDPENPAPALIQIRIDLMEIEFVTAKDFGRKEANFAEVADDTFDKVVEIAKNMGAETFFPEDSANGAPVGTDSLPTLVSNTVYTATEQLTETLNTGSGGSKIMNYAKVNEQWYTQQILQEGNVERIGQWEPSDEPASTFFSTSVTPGKFKPSALIPGNIVPFREAGS